jgi:hypothetical protein
VEGTEYDFQQPRRIGSTRLDHAFTDLERDQDGLLVWSSEIRTAECKSRSGSTRATRTS